MTESEALLSKGYSTWYAFCTVMRHIAEHHDDVDFVVSTGDLVDKGTDPEYQYFRAQLGMRETSGPPGPQRMSMEGLREMPMYFLPGNHDPRAAFFHNMFPQASLQSMNVTFERSGIQFICLDWGEQNKAIASAGMFDFLERALQRDVPSIIWMHHAVVPIGTPRIDSFLPDEVSRFAERVKGHSILGIFCGHTHATYTSELAGVPVYGLRSTTYSFAETGAEFLTVLRPPHYRVVRVDGGKLSSEVVEVAV